MTNEPLITLTVGPRDAHIDSASGLRFYNWRGTEYPSVTSIRRMAGLPFRLHQWAISKVVKRAVEERETLNAMMTRERRPRERYDPDIQYRKRVKETSRWLRAAATEERDAKAERGTAVHDAAAKGLSPDSVDPSLRAPLIQFYDWLDISGAEIIAVEQQVFNLTLGYAGTFDILCRLPDGSIWVVDLKTGNSTYVDHVLQQIGYAMSEFVGSGGVINEDLTRTLHAATGMALLHLTDDGWTWQEIKVTPDLFEAFKGLLKFAKFAFDNPEMDNLVENEEEGAA